MYNEYFVRESVLDRQSLQQILGAVDRIRIDVADVDQRILVGTPGELWIECEMDMGVPQERGDVGELPVDRAAAELDVEEEQQSVALSELNPLLDQGIFHPKKIHAFGTGLFLGNGIDEVDRRHDDAVGTEPLIDIGLRTQPADDLLRLILAEDAHLRREGIAVVGDDAALVEEGLWPGWQQRFRGDAVELFDADQFT
jgi:hypothetical protein